jgi:hypothetical protein
MGEVMRFPKSNPNAEGRAVASRYSVTREFLDDQIWIAAQQISALIQMKGSQEKSCNQSNCQPGSPLVHFGDGGLTLEWTIPRSKGRQVLSILLDYDQVNRLIGSLDKVRVARDLQMEAARRDRTERPTGSTRTPFSDASHTHP